MSEATSPLSDQAGPITKLFAVDPVFDAQAYETLRPVSMGLVLAFIGFVILGFIDQGPGGLQQAAIVGTDVLSALVFLALYWLMRRGVLTQSSTVAVSLVYVAITTANVLLAFWLTANSFFLTYLPIIILGVLSGLSVLGACHIQFRLNGPFYSR